MVTYNHMVVGSLDHQHLADRCFHALADATRRDIVTTVLQREHSVSALSRRYPMSFAAVQKHVAILERAELVTKERHGREQRVRGNIYALRQAHQLFDELEGAWRGRIELMSEILEAEGGAPR